LKTLVKKFYVAVWLYGILDAQKLLESIDRKDLLIKVLEKEAFRVRRKIRKTKDRMKRDSASREYAKLISRIKEIKSPTPLELIRYE